MPTNQPGQVLAAGLVLVKVADLMRQHLRPRASAVLGAGNRVLIGNGVGDICADRRQ
jgi:hypothetical protein